MSVSEAQRQKIASYVRKYIIRTAERHGHQNASFRANARWMHTLNVRQNVLTILDGEHASEEARDICEIAAFFHDIDHYTVQHEYHAMRGAETATHFLMKEVYDPDFVRRVAHAVREHNRDLDDTIPVPDQIQQIIEALSFEERMVMDADTLDNIRLRAVLGSGDVGAPRTPTGSARPAELGSCPASHRAHYRTADEHARSPAPKSRHSQFEPPFQCGGNTCLARRWRFCRNQREYWRQC